MPGDGGVFLQRDRAMQWCYCMHRDRATLGDGEVFLRRHLSLIHI